MRLPSRVLPVALLSAVLVLPTASVADLATSRQVEQRGTTSLTAPIVQPGRGDAPSGRALVQGTVSFKPAEKGRKVVVERRTETSDWEKVTTVRQDGKGVARFTAPASASKGPYTYRGVALRAPGLPKFAASEESTTAWDDVFTDEFSGAVLSSQWADRPSDSTSRKCSVVGDPRARSIGGGTLKLRAILDPARKDRRCKVSGKKLRYYLNGQVSTSHLATDLGHFTHGTFAARIKFPANRGQHGAFWMQPTKGSADAGTAAASGAEIDVVEFFGKGYQKGGLASFLYNYGVRDRAGDPVKIGGMAPKATRMLPKGDAWWKRFHVFSVEWTPNRYTFMVDGRPHFSTKRGVSGVDEYLILSMLTSDWELLQAKKLGVSPGGAMQVDWVRVWQRP